MNGKGECGAGGIVIICRAALDAGSVGGGCVGLYPADVAAAAVEVKGDEDGGVGTIRTEYSLLVREVAALLAGEDDGVASARQAVAQLHG